MRSGTTRAVTTPIDHAPIPFNGYFADDTGIGLPEGTDVETCVNSDCLTGGSSDNLAVFQVATHGNRPDPLGASFDGAILWHREAVAPTITVTGNVTSGTWQSAPQAAITGQDAGIGFCTNTTSDYAPVPMTLLVDPDAFTGATGAFGHAGSGACDGSTASPGASQVSYYWPAGVINGVAPEGERQIQFQISDLFGNSTKSTQTTRIDRAPPQVVLDGRLGQLAKLRTGSGLPTDLRVLTGAADLSVLATDGKTDPNPAPVDKRSGVNTVTTQIWNLDANGNRTTVKAQLQTGTATSGDNSPYYKQWQAGDSWLAPVLAAPGLYELEVRSTDRAFNSVTNNYDFAVGGSTFTTIVEGQATARWLPLQLARGSTYVSNDIHFEWSDGAHGWTLIQAGALQLESTNAAVTDTSHLSMSNGTTPRYILDLQSLLTSVSATDFVKSTMRVRAIFGSSGGYADQSEDVMIRLDRGGRSTDDGQADMGVGNVDLLTGNFSIHAEDTGLNSYLSGLTVTRSYDSRYTADGGSLGNGWKLAAPVEGQTDFVGIQDYEDPSIPQDQRFPAVAVTESDGSGFTFERQANDKTYKAEAGFEDFVLTRVMSSDPARVGLVDHYEIWDKTSGMYTLFGEHVAATVGSAADANKAGTGVVNPGTWSVTGTRSTLGVRSPTYTFETKFGAHRLTQIIAPTDGLACTPLVRGCEALEFSYSQVAPGVVRLSLISMDRWNATTNSMSLFNPLIAYNYDANGQLTSVNDQRTGLATGYAYDTLGRLSQVTPPGERPYNLTYNAPTSEDGMAGGRLATVSRDSLVGASPTATWTMQYDVPRSGVQAPWDLSYAAVSKWGQAVTPFRATAVSPPGQPVGTTASALQKTTIAYLDALGREINHAEPGPANAAGNPTDVALDATDFNKYGNVTRTLTPSNLATVRQAPAGSQLALAGLLSTQTAYSNNDYQRVVDVRGPEHDVKLPGSSTTVRARDHSWSAELTEFDEGVPSPSTPNVPQTGTTTDPSYPFNLPTTVHSGVLVTSSGSDQDVHVSKASYQWSTRQVTSSTVDATGPSPVTRTFVRDPDGNETERRQPSASGSSTAPTTTLTSYYRTTSADATCNHNPEWIGLVCKVGPGSQPTATGLPKLPVKTYTYDRWRRVANIAETVVDAAGSTQTRSTTNTYDGASDRLTKEAIASSSGAAVNATVHNYDLGGNELTTNQVDNGGGTVAGATVTRAFDALNRITSYTDASGDVETTTYDIAGRVAQTVDNKAAPTPTSVTRTVSYDPATGDPIKVLDSGFGDTITSNDIEGRPIAILYPGGISKGIAYDEVGRVRSVNYLQTSGCSSNCTLYSDAVTRNGRGQLVDDVSSLGSRGYSYDGIGRLSSVNDTPTGAVCTTRTYVYDADSNRISRRSNAATSVGAACPTAGGTSGTTVDATYDNDRQTTASGYGLGTSNVTYDAFGRAATIPKQGSGGTASLTLVHFADDMLSSVLNGTVVVTNTLDAMRRIKARSTQISGQTPVPTDTYTYGDDGDAPIFTTNSGTTAWTRYASDASGGLAAQITSGGVKNIEFGNVRGDTVAEASSTATAVTVKFATDEFGVPTGSTMATRKYGFIGSKQRETFDQGNLVSMGERTYSPQLGRFLEPDPVLGGSAGPYDYANQDPINSYDLDGRVVRHENGAAVLKPSKRRPKPVYRAPKLYTAPAKAPIKKPVMATPSEGKAIPPAPKPQSRPVSKKATVGGCVAGMGAGIIGVNSLSWTTAGKMVFGCFLGAKTAGDVAQGAKGDGTIVNVWDKKLCNAGLTNYCQGSLG